MYKYTLSKYEAGGRNRYTCPRCGQRKCFSRYVDTDTNQPLEYNVGKCDHVNSCGYHYTPSEFFHDHPARRPTDWQDTPRTAKPVPAPPPPRPLCTVNSSYVNRSQSPRSQFVSWLTMRFPTKAEAIHKALCDYRLGATKDGGVIFWQIDPQGRVRSGKVMHYGTDGHRTGNPYWVHTLLQRQGQLPADWTLTQCLFGEHLLTQRPADTVCLVESEKTAIVCSLFYPSFLWLATGGCGQLSVEKLKRLIGRKVVVYPDSGALEKWETQLKLTQGLSYTLVRQLETYPPNTDLADLMLHEVPIQVNRQEAPPARPSQAGVATPTNETHTEAPPSIDRPQNPAERLWEQMQQADPAMLALAQAFELIPVSTDDHAPF